VIDPLVGQLLCGQLAQLVIDERQKIIRRAVVATFKPLQ
jgi:hypothetical protein